MVVRGAGAMTRVFVPALATGELIVRGDEHHYVAHVRRARAGDALELCDGEGQRASAQIVAIRDGELVLAVGAIERVPDASPRIRVLLPLIKGDRMETCLEKLVEVGADELIVWPAERAVVRLDGDRLEARRVRYQEIVRAAARQSGRPTVPVVGAARSLAAALAGCDGACFVLDPGAARAPIVAERDTVTFASGPEGGLAPAELDTLLGAGFAPLGLGPRTLRADTAPVIAVALARAATDS